MLKRAFLGLLIVVHVARSELVDSALLDACPGYTATSVNTSGATLTAELVLAGKPCNVFGDDIPKLLLSVVYETNTRIHLKITDANSSRFEVPENVLPRPSPSAGVTPQSAAIHFNYTSSPFSFTISRTRTSEIIFSTVGHPLIFEPQYLRLKTSLPANVNIYGLGEHTNTFRLDPHNTTRTLWARNSFAVPTGTNLYSSHPVYFEHRSTGTHGVFMLNANGMDVKINDFDGTPGLEYNIIGGVFDVYFLAGSEDDPEAVARQYAEIVGTPAEVPYWSFGLHQCKFGYKDFVDVARVIQSYADAEIPLETMWVDIDYMDHRRVFSLDPQYFPLSRMREVVDHLHDNGQHFVVMTDPAVAYTPGQDYAPFNRGSNPNIWLKTQNGSDSLGLVWPGVTVFPDWFNPQTQTYWSGEFQRFYDASTGLDIDGVWIDMNDPTSFCNFPCDDPFAQAVQQNLPPARTTPPPDPNAAIFVNSTTKGLTRRAEDRNLFEPPYAIDNAAGGLANGTAPPDALHGNGMEEYDVHNLFGTMMSTVTQKAMLARRPNKKTLVITRSTFAGAGASVGKWLGDNLSLWEHYRFSIAGLLGMASVYQIPMVGSDICGFDGNTTETLCSRWATLGAFYPFMRNHASDISPSQEFYVWPSVAAAAKNALDIRYRLMDYLYTAFHQANKDGSAVIHPLWFKYPKDPATFSLDLQFFYGDSILVSPVTEEAATTVDIYLPKDIFYDFKTLAPVQGNGSTVALNDVAFTEIPLHIRGGVVLPLRASSALTTEELKKKDFELVVAPGSDGKASGQLYIDDGESIVQQGTTEVAFAYVNGTLGVTGEFGYNTGSVEFSRVRFLNVKSTPKSVEVNGKSVGGAGYAYNDTTKVLDVTIGLKLTSLSVSHS